MNTLPNMITNSPTSNHEIVFYDKSVPERNRIKGLIDYLEIEYLEFIRPFFQDFIEDYYRCEKDSDLIQYENHRLPLIPVLLSKRKPKGKQYFHGNDYLTRKIEEYIDNTGRTNNNRHVELKTILDKRSWIDTIFGEYHTNGCPNWIKSGCVFENESGPYKPYIVLYYTNTNCPNEEDYKVAICNCLAHEYFHFIHHYLAKKTFKTRSKYGTMIKESLADFASVLYTLKQYELKQNLEFYRFAESRYNTWEDRADTDWPYAKALQFYKVNNRIHPFSENYRDYEHWGSITKAYKVLNASCSSMRCAYNELLR